MKYFEHVVEASEAFDEDVGSFVSELVASGNEEVERFVNVEVEVAVEVAPDKLVDLLFVDGVQVLELVQGGELLDVESVGCDDVGLPLEQMHSLQSRDLRDGGESVGQVGSSPLHAVAVVDLSFASLFIDVEVVQVVVKVDFAGTEVAAQQSGVRGENRGHFDAPEPQQDQTDPGQPLVEVGYDARRRS